MIFKGKNVYVKNIDGYEREKYETLNDFFNHAWSDLGLGFNECEECNLKVGYIKYNGIKYVKVNDGSWAEFAGEIECGCSSKKPEPTVAKLKYHDLDVECISIKCKCDGSIIFLNIDGFLFVSAGHSRWKSVHELLFQCVCGKVYDSETGEEVEDK